MKISPQFKSGKIYLRIDHLGRQSLFKTPYTITKSEFNTIPDRYGNFVKNHPDAGKINRYLKEAISAAQDIWKQHRFTEPIQLKEHLVNFGFLQAGTSTQRTVDFIQAEQENRTPYNQRTHKTLIGHLNKFDPNVKLNEWTKTKVAEFEKFLKDSPRIKSQNTIWGRLKDLKANLNKAVYYDLITADQNPFNKGIKLQKGGSRDVKLEQEDLVKLWAIVEQHRSVQLWFFCFLLDGARVGEVINLKQNNIVSGRIEYDVSKKGHERIQKSIPITDKIQYLLDLMNRKHQGEHLVGFVNAKPYKKKMENITYWAGSWNAYLNKELKIAAEQAGVKKRLIFHAARNTFAYMAVKKGFSLIEIQDALKHTNIQITRDYIGRLENDRLDAKRKGLEDLF